MLVFPKQGNILEFCVEIFVGIDTLVSFQTVGIRTAGR